MLAAGGGQLAGIAGSRGQSIAGDRDHPETLSASHWGERPRGVDTRNDTVSAACLDNGGERVIEDRKSGV